MSNLTSAQAFINISSGSTAVCRIAGVVLTKRAITSVEEPTAGLQPNGSKSKVSPGIAPLNSKAAAKDAEILPFGRSLPMLLMRARESVMKRFRPHLRSHELTEQQWRILRVLAEQKRVEMLDLSERSCILPASLSRTIPLLVTRGLVHRYSDPVDQRRVIVALSPQGRALFQTMSAESTRIYARLEADFGATKLAEVYRVLNELIAVCGDAGGGEDE
jgi:homoprotocatechuate degradation regulator HpaR